MNIEEKTLLATIIIGITQIVFGILALKEWKNTVMLICGCILFLIFSTCVGFLAYRLKTIKRIYKIIEYLFHNTEVNQFNIVPKLLLYMNKMNKYNNVSVDTVQVVYDIYHNEGRYDSDIRWEIKGVCNDTKKDISEYYFYTACEFGDCECHKVHLEKDNDVRDFEKADYYESNRIKLLTWGFPKMLQPGNRVQHMQLFLRVNGSFDFSQMEVIYFIPRNVAKKINGCSICIKFHYDQPPLDMELRKIGYLKRNAVSQEIVKVAGIKKEQDLTEYTFFLDKSEINMEYIYYILIMPREHA